MLRRRFRSVVKIAVTIVVGVLLYCEWIVYLIQPLYWNMPQCHWSESVCTKILFIADPQIQGEESERAPQRYLYNWDSDRYLRLTFNEAMKHFKPDILVFLGDLMDEGFLATSEQFDRYVKRLKYIFDVQDHVSQIWVPGDNDIGGEFEPVKIESLDWFNKAFNQPDVFTRNNITFFIVNKIVYKIPTNVNKDDRNLRIAVSHYTLTRGTKYDIKTYENIRQDISFCGNDHESRYRSMEKDGKRNLKMKWYKYGDDVLKVTFNSNLFYEIFVPTCSYRMGTNVIGYGAAVIGNNNTNMEYSVLWSSERFPLLYAYLAVACLVLFYSVYSFMITVNVMIFRTIMARCSYNRLTHQS